MSPFGQPAIFAAAAAVPRFTHATSIEGTRAGAVIVGVIGGFTASVLSARASLARRAATGFEGAYTIRGASPATATGSCGSTPGSLTPSLAQAASRPRAPAQ